MDVGDHEVLAIGCQLAADCQIQAANHWDSQGHGRRDLMAGLDPHGDAHVTRFIFPGPDPQTPRCFTDPRHSLDGILHNNADTHKPWGGRFRAFSCGTGGLNG